MLPSDYLIKTKQNKQYIKKKPVNPIHSSKEWEKDHALVTFLVDVTKYLARIAKRRVCLQSIMAGKRVAEAVGSCWSPVYLLSRNNGT